jgi:hypothetical protein
MYIHEALHADVYTTFDDFIQRLCGQKNMFWTCLTRCRKQIQFLKKRCPRHAPMKNRLENIQVHMERCPRKLTCQLEKECGIPKNSITRGLKALGFHNYKVSLVQKLTTVDTVEHKNFCCSMLQSVHDKTVDTMFFHEQQSFVSSYQFCECPYHWDIANPHTIHDVPFRDEKLGV